MLLVWWILGFSVFVLDGFLLICLVFDGFLVLFVGFCGVWTLLLLFSVLFSYFPTPNKRFISKAPYLESSSY